MIYFLDGIIVEKFDSFIIINVNGIGYRCTISSTSFNNLPDSGSKAMIYTFHHITESSQTLFGFTNLDEKDIFEKLITVSGIGPKIAISILSSVTSNNLIDRIIQGKVDELTSLPGIGPKTAKRIIVELRDKFKGFTSKDLPYEGSRFTTDQIDAYKTIKVLYQGMSREEIEKYIISVVSNNKSMSTENIVKEVLSLIKQ